VRNAPAMAGLLFGEALTDFLPVHSSATDTKSKRFTQ